jgi:hypothetical protein
LRRITKGVSDENSKVFGDDRGFFFESFNQAKFEAAIGRHVTFVQDNQVWNDPGIGIQWSIDGEPVLSAKDLKANTRRSGAFRMTPTDHSPLTTYQAINPHAAQPTSLVALGKSLWRNRRCLTQARRPRLAGKTRRARVDLVHLVCLIQPNKRERPEKQERPAAPRACGVLLG